MEMRLVAMNSSREPRAFKGMGTVLGGSGSKASKCVKVAPPYPCPYSPTSHLAGFQLKQSLKILLATNN